MRNATSFNRVLIANRGEIALRAIRVCQRLGLETVAVYSTADAASPHVWAATRSVCIGPPPARDSYLSIATLLHVALETGCDAVYPGYGFLAENAAFAAQCEENDIKFIGPSAETISTMGDKSRARETAVIFDVPVVPGSADAYVDLAQALEAAGDVGFPMLIKARSGGGGRGMRIVEREADFAAAFARRRAKQRLRSATVRFTWNVFSLPSAISKCRYSGDGKGGSLEFDERDCSVQRRHQKLVEESPSPVVNADVRRRLLDAAGRLTRGIRYEGAGTVEFIMDTESDEFYFIEMNTRIQVEHTVTEVRVGLDLVEVQLDIAQGKPLRI